MSAAVSDQESTSADAAAGAMLSLPLRKRKEIEDVEKQADSKIQKIDTPPPSTAPPSTAASQTSTDAPQTTEPPRPTVSRVRRLDQNRKAARESRRRKKGMIEELQRSVIFFSRANGTLKQQNDKLSALIVQAQAQVVALESGQKQAATSPSTTPTPAEDEKKQAFAEIKTPVGVFPAATQVAPPPILTPAAAPNLAELAAAVSSTTGAPAPLPQMEPGATMQAMATFQQAAAAAMQTALQGMQGIPGVNLNQLAAAPVGATTQQTYTDTMTAMAMQQAAAAAAAGQHLVMNPYTQFFAQSMIAWQQQQMLQQQQVAQQQQAQQAKTAQQPQTQQPQAQQPQAQQPQVEQPQAEQRKDQTLEPTQEQAHDDVKQAQPASEPVPAAAKKECDIV